MKTFILDRARASSHADDGGVLRLFLHGASRTCAWPRVRRVASSAGASRVARASAEGAEGSKVLVVGATGGVGQLVVAKLLEAGYRVRAAGRSAERARETFGDGSPNGSDGRLEIVSADLRDVDGLLASNICRDVDAIVSCVGTTAFPSARWRTGTALNRRITCR